MPHTGPEARRYVTLTHEGAITKNGGTIAGAIGGGGTVNN
jgi:hypothetical protein